MDDLRAGGKVHNAQRRSLLIPHRRDVVEHQAKVLTFAGGQGSCADWLRVHVRIAGANQAEGGLQDLGSIAGFIGEGGLECHRCNGAIAAILDGAIHVSELIAGKVTGLADLDIAQGDEFRIGVDGIAIGVGSGATQPERQPEAAADDDQRNHPRHPVTIRPLHCTIH